MTSTKLGQLNPECDTCGKPPVAYFVFKEIAVCDCTDD